MPDSASDNDPSATTPLKNPHRPAPPVPANPGSPRASSKINSEHTDCNEDMIEVLDSESFYNGTTSKRRKAKHPMSRRTLRQRKIHSLKRQIQIKEKMLEVGDGPKASFIRVMKFG